MRSRTTREDGAVAFERSYRAALEKAHSRTVRALAESARSAAQVGRRTRELAGVRARLAREIEQRKALRKELESSKRQQRVLLEHSRLAQGRMRRLSYRLLSAQEEERLRISRDLHDAIGQTLTGINVGLATLKNEAAAKSRELASAIAGAQRLVERSMKTVHRFAWELRPPLLDDLGLVPALRSYTKSFAERTGVKVRFASAAAFERMHGDLSTVLFRVAQGALANVERHAHATLVHLDLCSLAGKVQLEVRDDGRSFDVRRTESSKTNRHLGLLVMRERAEMVGGSFSIESSRGRGTTVRVEVPLAPAGGRT